MTKLAFLDTETTSLNRRTRQAWDIAYILRESGRPDAEHQMFVGVDLNKADPMSLKIGGYYDRHPSPFGNWCGGDGAVSETAAAKKIAEDLRDAIIVGAVPSFDEETLANLLRQNWLAPTWHYHLVDVESLAAGALQLPPRWDFDSILDAYGLTYDEADRHTALGDARMVRDLYDAVMTRAEQ